MYMPPHLQIAMSQSSRRRCPYCNDVVDSRGLYAHVMHTPDQDHGEGGTVPEDFSPREAPIVTENEEVIETDIAKNGGDTAPNQLLMCHYCGTMAKGQRGMSIHLSKGAGDELHPPDASIEQGNFTEIPADEDWNPLVEQSEVAELHSEITSDVKMGESDTGSQIDPELQEQIDNAAIPSEITKVEQVASLLIQVPDLYNKPEIVKDVINCSTTTYYEGRKMYDKGEAGELEPTEVVDPSEVEQREASDTQETEEIEFGENDSVFVGGEPYVPLSEYKKLVKEINRLNEELNEVGNKGAQIIYRSQNQS